MPVDTKMFVNQKVILYMKSNVLLTILVVIALTVVSSFTGYYILTNVDEEKGFNVTKTIDGDTIEIETGEKVRLLGINAPEENEYYFKEAKERLVKLVERKSAKLEAGSEDKDRYGRLLRYVFIGDTLVNLQLVKEGYATVYIISPDEKYYLEFKKAEKEAKESKLGLWSISGFSECINITEFHYTGEEYVKFRNNCGYTIKMDGWEIKDEATHIYVFKVFVLNPNSNFTLFTGFGSNTVNKLYWNSKTTIWNNDGDTLFLRDDKGNLVLSYSYP